MSDYVDYERNLLSACLSDLTVSRDVRQHILEIPAAVVKTADHRVVLQTIQAVLRETGEVDYTAVLTALQEAGYDRLRTAKTFLYLEELRNLGALPSSIPLFVDKLEAFQLDAGVQQAAKYLQQAATGEGDWGAAMERYRELQTLIRQKEPGGTIEHIGENKAAVETLLDNPAEALQGDTTGIAHLDHLVTLHTQRLYILKGYPSHGKTTLGLNMLLENANRGIPGVVFSLETGVRDVRLMFLSMLTKVVIFNRTSFSKQEREKLQDGLDYFEDLPLYVSDQSRLAPGQLRQLAREYVEQHGVQRIMVDYLQKMRGDSPKDGWREQLEQISQELKNIAKELDVTVIAISNLSKPQYGDMSKPPVEGQEKGSSNIDFDADINLTVHNYEKAGVKTVNGEAPFPGQTLVRLDKNKTGPIGQTFLQFQKPIFRFYGYTEREETR